MEAMETDLTLADLGHILREERIRRGLSVEAIANQLKITSRVVRAIEDGDVESMPHAVYARGFIRSYARLLGMEDGLVKDICTILKDSDEASFPPEPLDIPAPSARKSSRIPWFTLLLCFIFILGGIWYFRDKLPLGPLSSIGKVAEQPAPQAEPFLPEKAEDNLSSAPLPSVDAVGSPAVSEEKTESPAEENADPAFSRTASGDGVSAASGTPVSSHSVVISASSECWIHTTVDGNDATQRTLRKGESMTLNFSEKLVLKLGNAGGVNIVYDGRDIAQPGKTGQVKTIVFPQDVQN